MYGDPGINQGRHNTKKPGTARAPGLVSEGENVISRLNWVGLKPDDKGVNGR